MQRFELPARAAGGPEVPRIIDSMLVTGGLVNRLDLHLERTHRAIEWAYGRGDGVPSRDELTASYLDGLAQVPEEGDWFPLVEVRPSADGTIATTMLTSRPAPTIRSSTRLAIAADRRRFPAIKGADAEVTAADRGIAVELGDDDALYLDDEGCVREAANGAVVGWRGQTLLIPDEPGRVMPSTTVAAMCSHLDGWRPPDPQLPCSLASQRIVAATRVEHRSFRPDEVDELWYVNALHGFTPVLALDGEVRHAERRRIDAWIEVSANWWEVPA